MLELKDIFGHTVQQVPDMATAMTTAAMMPQVVDIHNDITGDTWSRSPGQNGPNSRVYSWVWHWENW